MIRITQVITALLLALLGLQLGQTGPVIEAFPDYVDRWLRMAALAAIGLLVGWAVGLLLGKLVVRAHEAIGTVLRTRSGAELVVGAAGLMVGLAVSFLAGLAVVRLEFVGSYLLLPMTLIISWVFAEMASYKHAEILKLFGVRVERDDVAGKLLDSSALIDGRVADIAACGFLEGRLVVPVFVLEEMQHIADSSDSNRRARGKRGLDIVQRLRKERIVVTPDTDFPEIREVDSKLVRLARDEGYVIVTNDMNLNKVAKVQQVAVLNVNELADAMKPEFIPGDRFEIKLLKPGKEQNQGVGYLDDGTMVIVERGRDAVGSTVTVEVTSVLQSPTGKLVFARNSDATNASAAGSRA